MSEHGDEIREIVLKLLRDPHATLIRALTPLLHRPLVEPALRKCVPTLQVTESEQGVLQQLMRIEVMSTRSSLDLFRETTAPSLVLSTYAHTLLRGWMRQLLVPVIALARESMEMEIAEAVNTVSRTLLERLATMIVSIPRSFAKLCNALSIVASERFPDDKYTTLGGFFLLRILCPTIVSPTTYGVVEEQIPPKVMRILARVSKMILVCIGQKTEKKQSELVTSATALVFGVLDTLVDTGVALESEEESKGAMVRLQQRLTMRNLGNVEETTEIPVYIDDGDWTICRITVTQSTSVRLVKERLIRERCSKPITDRELRKARKFYSHFRLFIGPRGEKGEDGKVTPRENPQKQLTPRTQLPSQMIMLDSSDSVWHGEKNPSFGLWFVKMTDKEELARYEQAKAHRDAQMSQVCIMVDCISEARTINVTRTTSAQDCVKMLKAKLEDEQAGEMDVHSTSWLFVGSGDNESVLTPDQNVIVTSDYQSPPAMLTFKPLTEMQQRQFAKLKIRKQKDSIIQRGFVRVLMDDGSIKTLQATRGTTALQLFALLHEKYCVGVSEIPASVKQQLSNYWLFDGTKRSDESQDEVRRPLNKRAGSGRMKLLFSRKSSTGVMASGDDEQRPQRVGRTSSDELASSSSASSLSSSSVDEALRATQRVWEGDLEPEFYCRQMTKMEREELMEEIMGHLQRNMLPQGVFNLTIVSQARNQLELNREFGLVSVTECLKQHEVTVSDHIRSALCHLTEEQVHGATLGGKPVLQIRAVSDNRMRSKHAEGNTARAFCTRPDIPVDVLQETLELLERFRVLRLQARFDRGAPEFILRSPSPVLNESPRADSSPRTGSPSPHQNSFRNMADAVGAFVAEPKVTGTSSAELESTLESLSQAMLQVSLALGRRYAMEETTGFTPR